VESTSSLQKCICNGWRMHDLNRQSESIAYIYGNYRKSSRLRGTECEAVVSSSLLLQLVYAHTFENADKR
jgi:hypothetical protein